MYHKIIVCFFFKCWLFYNILWLPPGSGFQIRRYWWYLLIFVYVTVINVKVDTTNILFVCSGAFNGLEKIVSRQVYIKSKRLKNLVESYFFFFKFVCTSFSFPLVIYLFISLLFFSFFSHFFTLYIYSPSSFFFFLFLPIAFFKL